MQGVKEYIVPEAFEAVLEHLNGSNVPSIDTLATSFGWTGNRFRNPSVERAFVSIECLAQAAVFEDVVRLDASIRELLKCNWPGVVEWMRYFYIGAFDRKLVDAACMNRVSTCLNLAFTLPTTDGDDVARAAAEVPGTVCLATSLHLLENKDSYFADCGSHVGTVTLNRVLHTVTGNRVALDEMVKALDGNASLIVDTAVARLKRTFNSIKVSAFESTTVQVSLESAKEQLSLLLMLKRAPKHHPLRLALQRNNLIAIVMNIILRLLDIALNPRGYRHDSTLDVRLHISACLGRFNLLFLVDTVGMKPTLQALEAGMLTALAGCSLIVSSLDDRREIVRALHHFTQFTSHVAVARQASAALQSLENTVSVPVRIKGYAPDVGDAWKTFLETVLARRVILTQMQTLNSTPMSCDNVGRVYSVAKAVHLQF